MKVIDTVKETADFFRQVDNSNFPFYIVRIKERYILTGLIAPLPRVVEITYKLLGKNWRWFGLPMYGGYFTYAKIVNHVRSDFLKEIHKNPLFNNDHDRDHAGKKMIIQNLDFFLKLCNNSLEIYGPKKIISALEYEL